VHEARSDHSAPEAGDLLADPAWTLALSRPERPASAGGVGRALPPPAWSRQVPRLFATRGERSEAGPPAAGIDGFARLIDPLLDEVAGALAEHAAALAAAGPPVLAEPADAARLFLPYLRWLLVRLVTPTLVLELNVARVMGRLEGATSEARFADFCTALGDRATRLALYREYPVLARLLLDVTDDHRAAAAELLDRIAGDRPQLGAELGGGRDPGPVRELRLGLGDRHCGGRAVARVTFASGLEVIYKPRPLAIDRGFQDLLRWLERKGFGLEFHRLATLDNGDYGWAETVAARDCQNQTAAGRFYRRLGGILALLHVLGGTDFHLENVIAMGDQPVLVDLETLLHPLPSLGGGDLNGLQAGVLLESVARTGLLPERFWGGDEFSGVELSGLAGEAGQRDVLASRFWAEAGSDRMHAVLRHAPIEAAENRPRLAGRPLDPRRYREALEAGFVRAYRLLEAHRDELLGEESPLAPFRTARGRYLLRATRAYQVLLDKSLHPDYLRDSAERERLFEHLRRPADSDDAAGPHGPALFDAELRDLRRACVPLFRTCAGSPDLWTADGERLGGCFPRSPLDACRARLAGLSSRDLALQLWLLRSSFAKLSTGPPVAPRAGAARARPASPPAAPPGSERLIAGARRIGDRLAELGVRGGGLCGWFTVMPDEGFTRYTIKIAGLDLARGLPGIALFFAALARVAGDASGAELAAGALAALEDVIREYDRARAEEGHRDWPGASHGWGGVAYTLAWCSSLLDRPDLLRRAVEIARSLEERAAEEPGDDVARGSAGAVLALLAVERLAGEPALLAIAERFAERLMGRAVPTPVGLRWSSGGGGPPAPGFGGGDTGIGYALLRLGLRLGETSLVAAGRSALVAAAAVPSGRRRPALGWDHGLFGLCAAWSRPEAASLPGRDRVLRRALTAVAAAGPLPDLSLLQGEAGRAVVLASAPRPVRGGGLVGAPTAVLAALLERIECRVWPCAEAEGVEVPGLFTGLAGVGWALLQAATPETLPSLLTFDSPAASDRGEPAS
jgi:type 2 lantibiotic biosynthesis protein LanM